MFTVEFKTSGVAFDDYPQEEVVRILDIISNKVRDGYMDGNIVDINGNSIGKWNWKE